MRATRPEPDVARSRTPRFSLRTLLVSVAVLCVPCLVSRNWEPWRSVPTASGAEDLVERHPDAWWGVFWLPAFYVAVASATGFAWSVWRDMRTIWDPEDP